MHIYSPVHIIQYEGFPAISVKRDDLIDPYISGNKWRKLKYILQDAAAKRKSHLVTFGGAYSNHMLATAAAAARFGYKATAFVRGEEVENEMLLLCKLFGMKLQFIDREHYLDKKALFDNYFKNDLSAYFIDEGGASEQAVRGCAEIIDELPETYDYIFCAAGTGTTAAGLLRGVNQKGLDTLIHVVPVLKGGQFIEREIEKYEPEKNRLFMHTDYHFGGYAKTQPVLIAFMKDFIAKTGLLIDQVYTAKLFYAIYDLAAKKRLKEHAKIMVLHSGGLMGLLGHKEKFFNPTEVINT
ncbi:D-cysteine desulfhydrase [compost metagenome]